MTFAGSGWHPACTPRTEDVPTPAPSEEDGPAQGGILTDAGQAETLQDYYDRTGQAYDPAEFACDGHCESCGHEH